ncbi:MAG: copper amine oxidase N-terminal domain-containing protein [Anaerotignum sp.]|nr:copper amine oxidase N-terminal domain-containing protein [Anaerotignum sp.]
MKKKMISFALASAMAIGLFPITALADDSVTEISLMTMDFREVNSNQQGEHWNWNASSKTLTLNNFQGVVKEGVRENSAAILLPAESLLELEGDDNEITTNSYHCNGVYCDGDLFISGDGKLDINIESMNASAIYVNNGVLSMDEEAEVTIDSPRFAIYIYNLKSNKVAASVKDDAKFTFPDDLNADAIYVVTKSGVDAGSITFNYKETHDEAEDIVTLTKLEAQTVEVKPEETPEQKPEENPSEEIAENTYLISIGNKEIQKNGEVSYTSDAVPYLSNGYTMLPLRALLVLSDPNVEIKWDSPSKTATVSYNGKTVTLVAQQKTMIKDNEPTALSTAAEIKDGRLFVSLRDWMQIMEISDNQVSWDAKTKTVTLKH